MSELHVRTVARGFDPVIDVARRLLTDDAAWTFRLVVHAGADTVLDLHAGDGYADAVHLQASATKGVAGLTVAWALQDAGLATTAPVASIWPEFAVGGKGAVTIGELLSHQAGLVRSTHDFTVAEWGEARAVAADLGAQRPRWVPGRAHGYHALTIGPLADEIVLRLTGRQLWDLYDRVIRRPGDADFWVRLPAEQTHRIRTVVLPPRVGTAPEPTGSIADDAVGQLDAMGPGNTWINSRELVAAGVPSVSGTGSARGLADAYAAAIGAGGRDRVLSPGTVAAVSQLQTLGPDLVLGGETRYALMFQKPGPGRDFGTSAAFGHDGAGGALAFADPTTQVAFGYTTGRAPSPSGADRRALALAAEVRRIRLAAMR